MGSHPEEFELFSIYVSSHSYNLNECRFHGICYPSLLVFLTFLLYLIFLFFIIAHAL